MNKMLALAIAAPAMLIGAAYPDRPATMAAAPGAAPLDPPAPVTYRPCRPGRGDDRCIQLYERGVRASYARWLREHGVPATAARTEVAQAAPPRRAQVAAVGGPVEPAAAPRERRRPDDHRCHEPAAHDGEARGM